MNKYFVWLNGLKGPEAQIWDEATRMRDGKPVKPLADPIKLHAKDARTLDQLITDYPYE